MNKYIFRRKLHRKFHGKFHIYKKKTHFLVQKNFYDTLRDKKDKDIKCFKRHKKDIE
jgi:hypothetical protein